MMPSFGYSATTQTQDHRHSHPAHVQFGNGTGTGQMYPDGTFVYPSIAPIVYTPYDTRQEPTISQHPTAGALSSGIIHTANTPHTNTNFDQGTRSKVDPGQRQEYSSLQHLLEQAGYAETRVHTPPAERIRQLRQQRSLVRPHNASARATAGAGTGAGSGGRRIMRTFDEVDVDEVRDLYSAFGMGFDAAPNADGQGVPDGHATARGLNGQQADLGYETDSPTKVVCHITAPAIPLKSSSSVLRDVAMQDMAQQQAISPPSAFSTASGASSYSTRFGFDNNAYASFAAGVNDYTSTEHQQEQLEQPQQQHWWNGFGTSVLSRAAQTVREMSPTKEYAGFDFSFTSATSAGTAGSVASANGTVGLGLGLARGGQGVKKAKSAFTLGRYGMGGGGEAGEMADVRDREEAHPVAPPLGNTGNTGKEEREMLSEAPPAFSMPAPSTQLPSTHSTTQRRGASTSLVMPPLAQAQQHEVESDLWSPLPADYETQCEDDELFSTSFDVGSEQSFGSSEGQSPDKAYFVLPNRGELAGTHGTDVQGQDVDGGLQGQGDEVGAVMGMGLGMGGVVGGMASLASRIMRDAVDLDDCDDSPIRTTVALPLVNVESAPSTPPKAAAASVSGAGTDYQQRPAVVRASTTPSPASVLSDAPSSLGLTMPTNTTTTVHASAMPQAKKPLKYGDRATKLRMARSTPILTRSQANVAASTPAMPAVPANAGWLASIRSYLPTAYASSSSAARGITDTAGPVDTVAAPADIPDTPFRVTPALPAAPVARSAAVLCDSTSDMAEDLPAIPMGMAMAMAAHAQDRAELQGSAASAAAALARKISMGRISQQQQENVPSEQSKGSGVGGETQSQTFALRLRPSLAKMRSMVFGPPASGEIPAVPAIPSAFASASGALGTEGEGNTPMLSPRIDLAEGEAFAGWSPVKVQRGPRIGPEGEVYTPKKAVWAHHASVPGVEKEGKIAASTGATGTEGAGVAAEVDMMQEEDGYGSTIIDYTQSFFYKPCTPPAHLARGSRAGGQERNGDDHGDLPKGHNQAVQGEFTNRASSSNAQVAKRQRSIKSLRKALLIPVAPSAPPVPALPAGIASQRSAKSATASASASASRHSRSSASSTFASIFSSAHASSSSSVDSSAPTLPQLRTPPTMPLDAPAAAGRMPEPPTLAILSPGAWEAGLPPRALVLEEDDWEARSRLGGQGEGQDGDEAFGTGSKKGGKKGKGRGGKVRRKASAKSVRAE